VLRSGDDGERKNFRRQLVSRLSARDGRGRASMCVPVCSSNVISFAKKPSLALENFGRI
jgi:hypothetical protein